MATRVSSTRLIGRAAELATLRAALTDASAGEPSLWLVAGESGVGKSRLVAELEADARAGGARVLHGDCLELGAGELAYAPVIAALRPLVRDGDPVLTVLAPGVHDALPLPGSNGGPALAAGPGDPWPSARAHGLEALLELFRSLAAEQPLVLVLEDVHWADASTRALLPFLAVALGTERLLVIATYRTDELHRRHPLRPVLAELERCQATRRQPLERFTQAELAAQLAAITGAAPDPGLVARLFARTEGNPLFTEELVAVGAEGRGALPSTLSDALLLRVERLSDAAQCVLRLVSIGGRVPHWLLAAVADVDPVALREAVESHVLVVDADDRYAFRHALLREAVCDDLLPGERADAHARFAAALDRVEDPSDETLVNVANHYAAAGDRPNALRTAVAAGAAAAATSAFAEAAGHYERALAEWDRVPDAAALAGVDKLWLLTEASRFRSNAQDPAHAARLLRAAVAEVDADAEPERAAAILERLAALQWRQDQRELSSETRARARALLGEEPSPVRAKLEATEAKQLTLAGRYSEGVAAARRAIASARAVGPAAADAEATALDGLGFALVAIGEAEEGYATQTAAIELARGAGLPAAMRCAHLNRAEATARHAGRLAEGLRDARGALEDARAAGHPFHWELLLIVELETLAGNFAAAQEALPEPAHPWMANTWKFDAQRRVDLALVRGDHGAAHDLLTAVGAGMAESPQTQFIGPHAVALAELARRAGDLDAARAAIETGLDRIEFCSEDRAQVANVATKGVEVEADAACRARDLGDGAAAADALERADGLRARVAAIAEQGQPIDAARALVADAAWQRARGADDPARWAAAGERWAALGWAYEAQKQFLAAAEAALAGGDREAAAGFARGVRDATAAMGADWLLAEVEGLATRARLRLDPVAAAVPAGGGDSDADADPFGLTERERQVLALVAAGRTNAEIGQELFMAAKTASVHVSRILAKLDVRSRTEAAGVAHRLGLA